MKPLVIVCILGISILHVKPVVGDFECPDIEGLFAAKKGDGLTCKDYYECKDSVATRKSCEVNEGFHPDLKECRWEGFVNQCIREKGIMCGIPPPASDGNHHPEDSWVVAVLHQSQGKSSWEFLHPGLIISPTMVVTTCRLGETVQGKFQANLNPSSYRVIAGADDLNSLPPTAKNITVKIIKMHPNSSHASESHCTAILILTEPLDLHGTSMRAACLPVLRPVAQGYFGNGRIAMTAFRRNRGQLNVRRYTRHFKLGAEPFCRSANNTLTCNSGVPVPRGSNSFQACQAKKSVSTIYSPPSKMWFVLGIGSNYASEFCHISQFDKDAKLRWIMDTMRCGNNKFTCNDGQCITLDSTCNGSEDCVGGEDEDPTMCPDAGTTDTDSDTIPLSTAQTDSDTFTERPIAGCGAPEVSDGSEFTCAPPGSSKFSSSSCGAGYPVGTRVKFRCQGNYRPASIENSVIRKCRKDGTWQASTSLSCVPDCGFLPSSRNRLIVNGADAEADMFPWHAAIFFYTGHKTRFEYVCGGTLIHRKFILTAAHCILERTVEKYRVVLAAKSSRLIANERNNASQIHNVGAVQINERYSPRNNYDSDIAIIELAEAATLTRHVTLACLPSDTMQGNVEEGEFGLVPGLGMDESGKVSEKLKYSRFPVVKRSTCERDAQISPTFTQYCAGFTNGTGACNGDSGGGMVFERDSRYYLRGIVSNGPRMEEDSSPFSCNYKTYSVFTSVVPFTDWIKSSISNSSDE